VSKLFEEDGKDKNVICGKKRESQTQKRRKLRHLLKISCELKKKSFFVAKNHC